MEISSGHFFFNSLDLTRSNCENATIPMSQEFCPTGDSPPSEKGGDIPRNIAPGG